MSFLEFDLPKVQADFGLTIAANRSLFAETLPAAISDGLAGFWENIMRVGRSQFTDKGRSELLTAPLLSEVWHRSNRKVVVLSGVEWSVDPALGLNGVADFLLCRSSILYYVAAPALVTVQARRESITDTMGECVSMMIAAQRFNQKAEKPIDPIYGCVTTGSVWKFLRLSGQQLDIDIDEYSISQPDRILGVLLHCCGVIL